MMRLESLPNEIFYKIFDNLDVGERFNGFYNLNSRLNELLFSEYESYRINFCSILKCEMDFLIEEYVPSIVDRVISLRLSDDYDEGPSQTHLFFSSTLRLNEFIYLESLSLCFIERASIFRKIMDNSLENRHLKYVQVIKCNSKCMVSMDFSNNLWSFPQLSHCRLVMEENFCVPTVISLSLKYLSISCNEWWIRQTSRLIEQSPSLEHLHIPLNNLNDDLHVTLPTFPSITKLKLSNVRSSKVMENLVSSLPYLTYLKVDTYYLNTDGHTWAQIIDNHLPQLKIFHLRMNIQFRGRNNKEQVDQLFHSFKSEFWIEKHRWYIDCHPHYHEDNASVFVYTIPYAFNRINSNILTENYLSTSDEEKNDSLLENLTKIVIIDVDIPLKNLFLKSVRMFCYLKWLIVSPHDENSSIDLQRLIDRSPCLSSLTIKQNPSIEISLIEEINGSVTRLDIRSYNWYISIELCHRFIVSSLAKQCEELLINVEHRQSIIDLVNHLDHLRVLNAQYPVVPLSCHRHFVSDSSRNERSKDLSMKWFQDRLPQTSIICNFKSDYNSVAIHIYLRKR